MEEAYETCTDEDESDPEWESPPHPEARRSSRGAARYGSKGRTSAPSASSSAKDKLGDGYKSLLAVLETQAAGKGGRCGRPQASYATKDSITLSWRFPADAIGTMVQKLAFCTANIKKKYAYMHSHKYIYMYTHVFRAHAYINTVAMYVCKNTFPLYIINCILAYIRNKHEHTHARARTHTHARACVHTHTSPFPLSLTHTNTNTRIHKYVRTRTRAHARVGKELFTYEVEQCEVDEPTSTQPLPNKITADKWWVITCTHTSTLIRTHTRSHTLIYIYRHTYV